MALLFNWNASIHLRYCFEVWTCYALFKHLRYCSGLLCSVEAASYKLLNNSLQPGIKARSTWNVIPISSVSNTHTHVPKQPLDNSNPFQLWSYVVKSCNFESKFIIYQTGKSSWRMLWLEWDLFCKVDALQSQDIKEFANKRNGKSAPAAGALQKCSTRC